MDKIFSTRLDERLARQINAFAAKKAITKKRLIEEALRRYFKDSDENMDNELLEASFGAWHRNETTDITVEHIRTAFNKGFSRYQDVNQEQ